MPRVYANLAAYLEDNQITHEAFAAKLGVVPSYVSMLAKGERMPSLPIALLIAEIARIPIESLIPANQRTKAS